MALDGSAARAAPWAATASVPPARWCGAIGYETRLPRREAFNNEATDAGEVGSGRSVTALFEIVPVGAAWPPVAPLRSARPRRDVLMPAAELVHVRLRYRLPGEPRTRLVMRPMTRADVGTDFAAAPADARVAAAVAGFAERLRNSPELGAWTLEDVAATTEAARGEDADGRRVDFAALVRMAARLREAPR